MRRETILVTGGAGFIGSHLVEALIEDGYDVRVLDNLTSPAHNGKLPPWFNEKAEFIKGDVRNEKDWVKSLKGIDYVFHLASYMDMFSDFSTYVSVNTVSTALMYEVIVKKNFPIKKIIAASSQSVYGEGKYKCKKHGIFYPDIRPLSQLKRHQWEIKCPVGGENMTPLPEKESDVLKPVGAYGASKVGLEQVLFALGRLYQIPSVAMRYSIVQGRHQSFRHFYSGALRAYAVMGLTGQPIVTHEDGNQTRDFVSVHDVTSAHLAVLKSKKANGEAFNVGSGKSIKLIDLAKTVARQFDTPLPVSSSGHFRCATTRHSIMDISKLKNLDQVQKPASVYERNGFRARHPGGEGGVSIDTPSSSRWVSEPKSDSRSRNGISEFGQSWRPKRTVEDNVKEYIAWVSQYPEAKKFLEATNRSMKKQKMVF